MLRQKLKEGTPFSESMNMALWLLICDALEKHSLNYLLTLDLSCPELVQAQITTGEQSQSLVDHGICLFVMLMGFMPNHFSLQDWSHEG